MFVRSSKLSRRLSGRCPQGAAPVGFTLSGLAPVEVPSQELIHREFWAIVTQLLFQYCLSMVQKLKTLLNYGDLKASMKKPKLLFSEITNTFILAVRWRLA